MGGYKVVLAWAFIWVGGSIGMLMLEMRRIKRNQLAFLSARHLGGWEYRTEQNKVCALIRGAHHSQLALLANFFI